VTANERRRGTRRSRQRSGREVSGDTSGLSGRAWRACPSSRRSAGWKRHRGSSSGSPPGAASRATGHTPRRSPLFLDPLPQAPASRRIPGLLRAIPGLALLALYLIPFNLGQLLFGLVGLALPRAQHAYNRIGTDLWWRLFGRLAELTHGVRLVLTGDPLPSRENALILPNHLQMTDICFLTPLAVRCGAGGFTRWFVKDAVKHVPLMGWGMRLAGNLFVKRNWDKDRAFVERTFARIVRDRQPVWVMLFAEGTRLTERKLAVARRLWKRKGRPAPDHVLLPQTRGFTATVDGLGDHLDAVYDVTIAYDRGVPTLGQFICGEARSAHLHVLRIPIADLPTDEAGREDWLLDRFAAKSARLARFATTGSLDDPTSSP